MAWDDSEDEERAPAQTAPITSLLGALSSIPPPPPPGGSSASLIPLVMGQLQQSPAMGAANAFNTAFFAAQGRNNPYLQQQMQQQGQMLGIVDMLGKMQTREQANNLNQSKFLLAIQDAERKNRIEERQQKNLERQTVAPMLQAAVNSDSEAMRRWGFQQQSRVLQEATGTGYSPELIDEMAKGQLTDERRKNIIGYLRDGDQPEDIAAVYRIPIERVMELKQLADSPAHARELDLQAKNDAWAEEERGIKREAAKLAQIREERAQQAQELMARRLDLQETRAAASEARASRAEARADQRLDLAERNAAARQAELDRKFETKDDKRKATLATMRDLIDQTELEATLADNKGFLPKTSAGVLGGILGGDFSAANAKRVRLMNPNDSNWVNLTKILQGGGVGFERSVMNDIGPRAMAAYQGIMSFYNDPPSLTAIKKATSLMRRQIDIAEGGGDATKEQKMVYQTVDPASKQKRTFEVLWRPGFQLPVGARILSINGEAVEQ